MQRVALVPFRLFGRTQASQAFVVASNSRNGHESRRSFVNTSSNSDIESLPLKKIGVIGLGLMGHGIAQITAEAGYQVVALETKPEYLEKGLERIRASLSKIADKKVAKGLTDKASADGAVQKTLSKIQGSLKIDDLGDCDLVVEAIIENLDLKKNLAKQLGQITKTGTILASNTSSLAITEIAEASGRPTHSVGLHFFNPVQLMQLVEVVKTSKTDPVVFQTTYDLVRKIGKVPIACQDTPGFVVNRLLIPYITQALLLLERGDASKEDIDIGMRLGAGHPMGPIHLADYVGLDTTLFILEGWVQKYPNEPAFVIPGNLRQMVKDGKLGRKTGQGFYKWEGDKIVP